MEAIKENVLVFKDLDSMLQTLNADPYQRYYLCDCPECNHHEAYVYKNNPFILQCNRQKRCGVTFHIRFKENAKEMTVYHNPKKDERPLTEKQLNQIDWLTDFLDRAKDYYHSDTLENFRGLSRKTTKPYIVDLKSEAAVKYMFLMTRELFAKDYTGIDFMTKRNLIFPIKNEQGKVEGLLLRSTLDPSIKKKEIQLFVKPNARYFVSDIPEHCKNVIITESIIDGLSFREIDPNVGLLATTGAKKIRQVIDYVKENKDKLKDKHFIIAFDNDEAGKEWGSKIADVLDLEGHRFNYFQYDKGYKDPNEFLQRDRESFEKAYLNTKKEVEREVNDLTVKIKNMTYLPDKDIALATLQYGELTLNGIKVEEHKGAVFVQYPKIKGKDEKYYNVYSFSSKAPYDFDKRMIEGTLIKNYYELKYTTKDKVKDEVIQLPFTGSFNPIILKERELPDGKKSVDVAYKSVILHNAIVGQSENTGNMYVGFPFYHDKEDKVRNYVNSTKEFTQKIISEALKGEEKKKQDEKEYSM